jgi:lipoyl(octanoyl) transferase
MPPDPRPGYLLQAGLMGYQEARDLQRHLAAARAAGRIPDTLLLLEHPHTYTLGRSASEAHLLVGAAERAARGIGLFHVDRGGDITYHGPGQLVGYPILYLGRPGNDGHLPRVDYVGYLRRLEAALIRALAGWGLVAERLPGYTGVWVRTPEPVKIAAIGVRVDARGVSQHGFALNVCPDLSYFEGIIPCGIHDRGVGSMARLLDRPLAVDAVRPSVAEQFAAEFGLEWQARSVEEISPLFERRQAPAQGTRSRPRRFSKPPRS